jgi:hypothetical protein
MTVLSNPTKGRVGLKVAGAAIKNPAATRLALQRGFAPPPLIPKASAPAAKGGLRLGKTVAKRKANRRIEDVGKTARAVGETIATYGPEAAQLLGWVEQPKAKRTAPRVLVGVVIGAAAMYMLEPGPAGKERRAKARGLVS